jgi:hypothetical protein
MVPMFDVFSGRFTQESAIYIDSVEGMVEAYQTMLRLAAEKPGPYFIFSCYSRSPVAALDTTSLLPRDERECA